jgi:hypothetical protein
MPLSKRRVGAAKKEQAAMLKLVRKFFLICSGATLDLLERPECKTELTRFAMMGAFVLLTAIFASFSGGYALYTGFKNPALAIGAGVVWGAFIFTLDRFIVSSIRKKPTGDHLSFLEKALSTLSAIATALPRLIMAGFIAVTVAVPLELKYFEREIKVQLADNNREAEWKIATDTTKANPELEILEKELGDLKKEEADLTGRRDTFGVRLSKEGAGAGAKEEGYSTIPGEGPEFAKRREEYMRADEDLKAAVTRNEPRKKELQANLDALRQKLNLKIDKDVTTLEDGNGFLAQFKALKQLTANGPAKDMSLFLVILLMLVEVTPVLVKLFSRRGPYDDMLEAEEHKIFILKQKELSDFNSDINIELELYRSKTEARRQLEEQLIQDTLSIPSIQHLASDDVTEARTEIARATVSAWKLRQLQSIDNVS